MDPKDELREQTFLTTLDVPGRAMYVMAADLWEVGRNMVAAYQIETAQDVDVIVPPWDQLLFTQRIHFYMTARRAGLGQLGAAVFMTATLVRP